MPITLIESFPRLWSLQAGVAMVVTDLHGDWDAYQRYRDRFEELHAAGQADCLIFTGDLVHGSDPDTDQSVEVILDIIELRKSYGPAVICLCGNHEIPHIYSILLAKGSRLYTPAFEHAMHQKGKRRQIVDFFRAMPFFIRTPAGVSIVHAGAPAVISEPNSAAKLFNWNHQDILAWADQTLAAEDISALRMAFAIRNDNIPYEILAENYLAVSDEDDPRYNDLLRGLIASNHPDFDKYLWNAFFTRNEEQYGTGSYKVFLNALLQAFSADFIQQHVLVAGHMNVQGGHEIIVDQHLRLASAHHARPREAGQYLLFDTAQPVRSVDDLLSGLGSVFYG